MKEQNHMNDILKELFSAQSDILYGYSRVEQEPFAARYPSALVIAVPYGEQLTMKDYSEERFDAGINAARERIDALLIEIGRVLDEAEYPYYIPETAQKNETELLAEFSFKYAAVQAGLGWMGKNGVLVTERYGPRVRLSAVLIGAEMPYGERVTESRCGDCRLCADICPCKAISGVNWTPDTLRSELLDYHRCNAMRSGFISRLGHKSACGRCMAVCPWGTDENQ